MRTIKTGNELFDIFWKEYPARNNKKVTKKASLAWFKKHDPPEETVYDMIQWLKKDKENRDLLTSQEQFCPPPQDAIRFLNAEAWVYDEIGKVCTKTQRREAHRSKAVYGNNVQNLISQCEGIIKEWPIQKLLRNATIRAGRKYPEFRAWAIKQRPELKGAKADKADNPPPSEPKNAVATPNVALLQPDTTADLPPPKPEINRLVEQFIKDYDLFGK